MSAEGKIPNQSDFLEQRFLRSILKTMPSIAAYIDLDLKFRFVNQAFETWFNTNINEDQGTPVSEIVGAEVYDKILPHLELCLLGLPQSFSHHSHYKQGAKKSAEVHYYPDYNENHEVIGVIALVHDTSNLYQATQLYSTVFANSPNPILIFRYDKILDCNLAAMKILGAKSKEQLLNVHPAHFSPEFQEDGQSSKEKSQKMDALALQNGMHRFEWTHRTMDGKTFPVEVTLAPITIEGAPGVLVLWTDLRERKANEIQNLHSAKLISLGHMSAGLAHEINNPLTIIMSTVQQLNKHINNPEILNKKLETITRSCQRISTIVSSLKKFSSAEELSSKKILSLKSIVDNAINLTSPRAKRYGITLQLEIAAEENIECDELEIEQVIINLINNAIDAVKDAEQKWVRLQLYSEPAKLVLRVHDSGLPINPQIRSRIFDPFFTTKETGSGMGLGLSVANGIVQKHRGILQLLGDFPNTCFELQLPLANKSGAVAA